METKRRIHPEQTPTTKFIGTDIPLALHRRLRMTAAREDTSVSQLYHKAIVQYLDKGKK